MNQVAQDEVSVRILVAASDRMLLQLVPPRATRTVVPNFAPASLPRDPCRRKGGEATCEASKVAHSPARGKSSRGTRTLHGAPVGSILLVSPLLDTGESMTHSTQSFGLERSRLRTQPFSLHGSIADAGVRRDKVAASGSSNMTAVQGGRTRIRSGKSRRPESGERGRPDSRRNCAQTVAVIGQASSA